MNTLTHVHPRYTCLTHTHTHTHNTHTSSLPVPMDLDVKMKAVMLGACFLIVSSFTQIIYEAERLIETPLTVNRRTSCSLSSLLARTGGIAIVTTESSSIPVPPQTKLCVYFSRPPCLIYYLSRRETILEYINALYVCEYNQLADYCWSDLYCSLQCYHYYSSIPN